MALPGPVGLRETIRDHREHVGVETHSGVAARDLDVPVRGASCLVSSLLDGTGVIGPRFAGSFALASEALRGGARL